MKKQLQAILIGMAVAMTAVCNANAKSEVIEAKLIAVWPEPGQSQAVVKYTVEVTRRGAGLLEVELGTVGLPKGSGVTFEPEVLRFTGRAPETLTGVVTINLSEITPTDGKFAITAEAKGVTLIVDMNWQGTGGSPLAQPTLSIHKTGPDTVQVRGLGAGLEVYDIQAAADPKNAWALRGVSTADVNGRFTFNDTTTGGPEVRFYRSAQPVGEATASVSK